MSSGEDWGCLKKVLRSCDLNSSLGGGDPAMNQSFDNSWIIPNQFTGDANTSLPIRSDRGVKCCCVNEIW